MPRPLALLLIVALCAPACAPSSALERHVEPDEPAARALDPFLEAHRAAYDEAIVRARQWLDALRVDPFELREHGLQGKKKLVEQLDAYHRLWRIAPTAERPGL